MVKKRVMKNLQVLRVKKLNPLIIKVGKSPDLNTVDVRNLNHPVRFQTSFSGSQMQPFRDPKSAEMMCTFTITSKGPL